MPELPDILLYEGALQDRLVGAALESFSVYSISVLKTVGVKPGDLVGQKVVAVGHLGKRLWWEFDGGAVMLTHLMISGRFLWADGHPDPPKRTNKMVHWVAQFEPGLLQLTEASPKKRASLHVLSSRQELAGFDRGGLDVLESGFEEFWEKLKSQNRTLKRGLTDPVMFSGIGNAYSDEILHAARLSPLRLTRSLDEGEGRRLYEACRETLPYWADKLRAEMKGKFPGKGQVTAFRKDFAAHGKFGQPCPVCNKPIQRIRYEDNETNYCVVCQNEGRLLADRGLSRLLKDDWPKTLEQLYEE